MHRKILGSLLVVCILAASLPAFASEWPGQIDEHLPKRVAYIGFDGYAWVFEEADGTQYVFTVDWLRSVRTNDHLAATSLGCLDHGSLPLDQPVIASSHHLACLWRLIVKGVRCWRSFSLATSGPDAAEAIGGHRGANPRHRRAGTT